MGNWLYGVRARDPQVSGLGCGLGGGVGLRSRRRNSVLSLWNLRYQESIPGGLEVSSGSLESLKCR